MRPRPTMRSSGHAACVALLLVVIPLTSIVGRRVFVVPRPTINIGASWHVQRAMLRPSTYGTSRPTPANPSAPAQYGPVAFIRYRLTVARMELAQFVQSWVHDRRPTLHSSGSPTAPAEFGC